uniref:cytochrome c oxidase subunit II n=1 Tax=Mya japonica TaxID=1980395 RepID=UPI002A7FB6F3|nr:cytochrome c oxidase subunit II [Mya japonica]WNO18868.2 cytochrome c oxidase subunit 2 [Mya japonica]
MVEWSQLGFSNVVTATGSYLVTYYDIVMGVVVVITVIVGMVILAYFMPSVNGKSSYRYGSECAWLEILWTVSPAGVLIFLSFFSLTNLYSMEMGETIDYQSKITAHQWYWEYEYFLPKSLFESVFMRWNFDLFDRVGDWGCSSCVTFTEEVPTEEVPTEEVSTEEISIEKIPPMKVSAVESMKYVASKSCFGDDLTSVNLFDSVTSEKLKHLFIYTEDTSGGYNPKSFVSKFSNVVKSLSDEQSDVSSSLVDKSSNDVSGLSDQQSDVSSSLVDNFSNDVSGLSDEQSDVSSSLVDNFSDDVSGLSDEQGDVFSSLVDNSSNDVKSLSDEQKDVFKNLVYKLKNELMTKGWLDADSKLNPKVFTDMGVMSVCAYHMLEESESEKILKEIPNLMDKNCLNSVEWDCSGSEVCGEVKKLSLFFEDCLMKKDNINPFNVWFDMKKEGNKDGYKSLGVLYGCDGFSVGSMNVDSYLDYKLEKDDDDKSSEKVYDMYCSKHANHELKMKMLENNSVYSDLESSSGSLDTKAKYNFSSFNTLLDETLNLFTPRMGLSDQMFVLPSNKTTVLSVVTSDVMHSWGVPALGVKMDAVPGRMNSFPVTPIIPGFLQGQCYELCGVHHSAMPVNVFIFGSDEEYEDYLVHLSESDLWLK